MNYLLRSDESIKDQLQSLYPENPSPRNFSPIKKERKKIGRPRIHKENLSPKIKKKIGRPRKDVA
jgi:hypothetical protein